jgi:cation diffusion facilitator CzcD-associated flavoprotein CzcO
MSDYFAVIQLTPPLDNDGVRRLSRHSCLDIHQVQWLRSYVASDGAQMLCWYQAHDAESVRLVLRQLDSTGTDALSTEIDDDIDQIPADDSGVRVLAEIALEEPDPEAMTSLRAAAVAALRNAGQNVTCTFTSTNGARLILVVDGQDETVVTACLQSAGIEPQNAWRCVELDPQPPRLFTEATPTAARKIEHDPAPADAGVDFDAVIIGAGISGICALQKLTGMGLEVRLYESASDTGGVWYWNRYPGARVDSETYTYGFSFSDELLQEWDWQELFSPQPEIQRYLQYVVTKFDLHRHMQFDTRVDVAVYEDGNGRWRLETDTGEHVTARYLLAATGSLTAPQLPDYPGIDEFAGESHHTARWPATGVELAGKRIGVIGTGASGVQVIQAIADEVAHLTVFQRTPTYCVPQRNRPLSDDARRQIRRDWADILKACGESYGGFIHTFDPRSGLAVSSDEREAKFEELWQTPGFAFWFGNFADLLMNLEVNAHACDFVRRKIAERVDDPEVARKLLPDHPFGTKRIPLENGYYEVYNRDNVRLVDLRETPVERITPTGIRTSQEEYPLDIIVYATGFDAGTGALTRIDIRGEGGVTIEKKWRSGPKTFLGLLVNGFPNLFIVNGPHNAAALCNAGRCIEQNVDWIARCIEHVRAQGLTRVAPTAEAEAEWTKHVYDAAHTGVLAQMTDSWFFGANTPGKARRATIYAPGAREYREHCEDVARTGYAGCTMY